MIYVVYILCMKVDEIFSQALKTILNGSSRIKKVVFMLFSLFDVKADVFGRLFEARTCDEAKRIFPPLS